MRHHAGLGGGAAANTFTGLRWENSNAEIAAAIGSSYNVVFTGTTIHNGKITDAGTHNSFVDTFHNSTNALNGDLWRTQADQTVVDHEIDGIGLGTVRGHQREYETDVPSSPGNFQNAWRWGPGDGSTGQQVWELQDLINGVVRFGVQQNTTAGGNAQSYLNAAGTGSVCFNCSTNSGTGGVTFGSGGATPSAVASIDSTGNQSILGNLSFYSGATQAWQWECASVSQCILRNINATVPANPFIIDTNGPTEIDSQATYAVTVNNHSSSGTGGFIVYGGGATYYNSVLFSITGTPSAPSFRIPGLASSSSRWCVDIDNSGYFYNTGAPCNSGTTTSITVTAPSDFILTGCTITTNGTCAFAWNTTASGTAPTWNQSTSGNAATATYATTAGGAPPTGSCTGDLTGTEPACVVAQINGGAPPTSTHVAGYDGSGKPIAAPNTYGCIDGYDHLPCTVFIQSPVSETAGSGSYTQVWPATGNAAAGIYRVTGYLYGTAADTCTTGSATAEQYVKATMNGGTANGWALDSAQVGSTGGAVSSGSVTAAPVFTIAASTTYFSVESTKTACSVYASGTATWTRAIIIERLQ